jgi:hypothetical protein
MKKIIISVLALFPFAAAAQQAPVRLGLEWPLKCIPNVNCFVERYPDVTAGQKLGHGQDFTCGKRTRDGLAGIEVVFPDTALAMGHPVLAAAEGRVVLVQNRVSDTKRMHPQGKFACGNEVRIRHANDYETRYCHLKQGSVTVQPGQVVTAGTPIGQTGSSGAVSNPVFAFYVLRDGKPLDPFSNQFIDTPKPCFIGRDRSLWKTPIAYKPAGVMSSGFARAIPSAGDIEKDMTTGQERLDAHASQLAAWVRLYGVEKDDAEDFRILTPKGQEWFHRSHTYGRDFPYWFTGIHALAPQGLEEGTWQATYVLRRAGEVVLEHSFFVTINAPPAPVAPPETEASATAHPLD